MEGALMKKTRGGQWHSRQFKLEGSNLTWMRSDNKNYVTVDISRNAEVRDVKFGVKKFMFEVVLSGDTLSFAASGEAEKAAWMAALNTAMGKRQEAEAILQSSGANRKSVRVPGKTAATTPAKPTPAVPAPSTASPAAAPAAAASPAPASPAPTAAPASPAPAAATLVTGGLATQAANAKLAAKLGGKLGASAQTLCVVCGLTVYKPEELIVDKAVMHKRCFQCNHCKRQLTMGNFACINSVFYCKVHYFELFSTNGGKYDKAFGDAGFQNKATTAYTPGEILQPGKLQAGKIPSPVKSPEKPKEPPVSPLPVASTAAAASASPVPMTPLSPSPAASASSPTAKPTPKKLEIKAPVSTKTVEKKEVEVIPKKNMDDLRKMVVLPGMQPPPKPKKEEEHHPPAEVSSPDATEAEKISGTEKPSEEPAASAPVPSTGDDQHEAREEAPPPEPQIQIVRPPAGINFALEAMKIRQAQLEKAGYVVPQEEPEEDGANARASVRMSGRLDHSAVLSKPRMAGRRAPKVQEIGKMLPKTEIDRMTHDWTFRVKIEGNDSNVLIVHATSQFERDHWVATLSANVYMLGLKHELEMAQKRDMMSALQAQLNLEAFMNDNKVTYSGFLEKVSMKSQRNWKKRWFQLTEKGELMYFENENSKKPKQTLKLSYLTVITSADGNRLDAPLVINTGATQMSAEADGALPQNIAIFDNEDVTIDLNVLVPDEYKNAAGEVIADPSLPPPSPAPVEDAAAPTASSDDFVVVEKEAGEPSRDEAPTGEQPKVVEPEPVSDSKKDEEPASPTSPDEASSPVEEKDVAKVEPEEPVMVSAPEDDDQPKKINSAWATPGKQPDRLGGSAEIPLRDEPAAVSPTKSKRGSRASRGPNDPKKCSIM